MTAEQREAWKRRLMDYGVAADAAERQIAREIELDFANRGKQFHTVYAGLLSFSFGTVSKRRR